MQIKNKIKYLILSKQLESKGARMQMRLISNIPSDKQEKTGEVCHAISIATITNTNILLFELINWNLWLHVNYRIKINFDLAIRIQWMIIRSTSRYYWLKQIDKNSIGCSVLYVRVAHLICFLVYCGFCWLLFSFNYIMGISFRWLTFNLNYWIIFPLFEMIQLKRGMPNINKQCYKHAIDSILLDMMWS